MRYGHDFRDFRGYGGGAYDRYLFGGGGRDRYFGAERARGDWAGGTYFDEVQEPWGPRYEGYGYSLDQSPRRGGGEQRFRGLPPGEWETGEPWGGEGEADRVRAAEIMTENPEAVTPDTPLTEVAQRMRDLDVGIIPVVESEESFRLQGVITDRDIAVRAAAEGKDMKKAKVSDFMTSNVESVHSTDSIREVFTVMKREQVRRVPVVDDQGWLVGIIAQADLAVSYAGLDMQRETEVEEVIERISEPARPRWNGSARERSAQSRARYVTGGPFHAYDRDLTDRLRDGWRTVQRQARHLINRGYDRGW